MSIVNGRAGCHPAPARPRHFHNSGSSWSYSNGHIRRRSPTMPENAAFLPSPSELSARGSNVAKDSGVQREWANVFENNVAPDVAVRYIPYASFPFSPSLSVEEPLQMFVCLFEKHLSFVFRMSSSSFQGTQHNASFSTQKHAEGGKHGVLGSKARKIYEHT